MVVASIFDNRKGAYNRKRDGLLDEYLETHDGSSCFPLFKGYRHFKMLWDGGYLEPNFSVIRVMYNIGRGDEHYGVLGEFELEGIENSAHGGKEGLHDPRKLLAGSSPAWEALHFHPTPISRVNKKTYFVFQYYHDKEHSALIPFVSDMKRIRELDGFSHINPEERGESVWNERCLNALVATGTKEVFSVRCRDAMRDDFLGRCLHYSGGEGKDFFHYDFVNPQTEGEKFTQRGIELKEFKRE